MLMKIEDSVGWFCGGGEIEVFSEVIGLSVMGVCFSVKSVGNNIGMCYILFPPPPHELYSFIATWR